MQIARLFLPPNQVQNEHPDPVRHERSSQEDDPNVTGKIRQNASVDVRSSGTVDSSRN